MKSDTDRPLSSQQITAWIRREKGKHSASTAYGKGQRLVLQRVLDAIAEGKFKWS